MDPSATIPRTTGAPERWSRSAAGRWPAPDSPDGPLGSADGRRLQFRRSGRTFPQRGPGVLTTLFFTNDDGFYVLIATSPRAICARSKPRTSAPSPRSVPRCNVGSLRRGRSTFRARSPDSGHDLWDSNRPGSPLCFCRLFDESSSLISLIAQFVSRRLRRDAPAGAA